jgi:diacylglycerol kinase
MNQESVDNIPKIKKKGFKRFCNSFKYSFDGLKYGYLNEQSLTIHISVAIIVIFAGIFLQISQMQWLFILMCIGIIMATELINTSIEATIDLISPEYNQLAKIAKDTASAAVFVFSVVALSGGLLIFLPKLFALL